MSKVAAVTVGCLLSGCNALLGIHELGDVDVDAPAADARAHDAHAGVDAPPSCYLPSALGSPTFGSQTQGALVDRPTASAPYTETYWYGYAGGGDGEFEVEIGATSGGGATGSNATPDWPTSLGPKSGLDLATNTDAFAVLATDLGSDDLPGIIYLADAGTLSLAQAGSAVGATFAGTIEDTTFVHVDVSGAGALTNDPDGCETSITSLEFSGTVALDPSDTAAASARPVRAARGE